MKKDRSNQKLAKADFEKFADYDIRFYGLFYTKTDNGIKVKIDPKRMRSAVDCTLSDEQMKIINRRRTHYFYLKKSEY